MRAVPAAATYPVQVADWVTISSLATAGGTLVLATAAFASVRSANRAARVAEESLLAATRPLLMPSRTEDPPTRVGFGDDHFVLTPGGGGTAEVADTAIYLTMSVRNVGNGVAVLHGWRVEPRLSSPRPAILASTASAGSRGTSTSLPVTSRSGRARSVTRLSRSSTTSAGGSPHPSASQSICCMATTWAANE